MSLLGCFNEAAAFQLRNLPLWFRVVTRFASFNEAAAFQLRNPYYFDEVFRLGVKLQ